MSAENPSAAQPSPPATQDKTHLIIAGLEKRLEEMSASNKQNMDDITSESAKGLEKVVELMEKRFKANGADLTALLKRSEKNNITALEKVIENATHLQEETSRRQKIEFERIARKTE